MTNQLPGERNVYIVAKFRMLHQNTTPLRLPNAWDAASARLFESLGATAIATTSGGLAWSLGYPDGRIPPIDEVARAAANMARVLKVPLSVDIENGYSDDPEDRRRERDAPACCRCGRDQYRRWPRRSGAAGFQDRSYPQRCVQSRHGFIYQCTFGCIPGEFGGNIQAGPRIASLEGCSMPALAPMACSCQGIKQEDDIRAVVSDISLPLNTMAWPGLAEATTLGELAVRRLSAGSAISQAIWGQAERLAQDFLKTGRSDTVSEGAMPYSQLQDLFPQREPLLRKRADSAQGAWLPGRHADAFQAPTALVSSGL